MALIKTLEENQAYIQFEMACSTTLLDSSAQDAASEEKQEKDLAF